MLQKKPLAIALIVTAFDAFWAYQALSAVPRNTTDTVGLSGMVVWVVFHLPAAAFAGWFSEKTLGLLPALGLLQTFLLSWGLAAWLTRKKA